MFSTISIRVFRLPVFLLTSNPLLPYSTVLHTLNREYQWFQVTYRTKSRLLWVDMSSSLSPDRSTEPTRTKGLARPPSTGQWSYSWWNVLPLPFYFWRPTSLAIPTFILRSISSRMCISEVRFSLLPQLMRSIMDYHPSLIISWLCPDNYSRKPRCVVFSK